MASLDYRSAGVDIQAGDKIARRIAALAKTTLNSKVRKSQSGFASLYSLNSKTLIAASTDGVGTKLKLAFRLKKHDTVGIDLVAMSVNDLLCVGAEPMFFLDYIASAKLNPQVTEEIMRGIIKGCLDSKLALVGGETAEMPGLYHEGEYDLAGFAVGQVATAKALPKNQIKPGDAIIGLASSGFHSNGFSLLRKLIPEGSEGDQLASELLVPTKIYVKSTIGLIRKNAFKGLAHITGSGMLNIPRLSESVSYDLELPPLSEIPSLFEWIREKSGLTIPQLSETFNMGIGLIAIVDPKKVKAVLSQMKRCDQKAWKLGEVVKRSPKKAAQIHIRDVQHGSTFTLNY